MATKGTFEQIILIKRLPVNIYWVMFGVFTFIVGEIGARIWIPGNTFVWSRVIAAFTFGFLPILNIWTQHTFVHVMTQLQESILIDVEWFEEWLDANVLKIFTLRSIRSVSITLFIVLGGVSTALMIGLPFGITWLNVAGLAAFIILLWFCGQTLAISIGILQALWEIVRKPLKVPFYLLPHPSITELQNFYSLAALAIVFLYSILVIAVWQGPYGINSVMLVWLSFLAFYPSSMLIWSFSQVHVLLRNIKRSYVINVNLEIQEAYEDAFKTNKSDTLDRLDKLMVIQEKVQAISEWPFAIEGVTTFILTILTLVIQIALSINELTNLP